MKTKETHIDVNHIRLLILERKNEIKEKFKAEVVEIFGSYARGEEKEGSDIDVLVRFGEGANLFDFTALEFYLEDLFGVSVDVVSERGFNPIIRNDILKGTAGGMKSPLLYLCEMLKAARNIKKFTGEMDKDTFLDDNKTKDAVVLQLEIIGEATKSVSDDIRSLSPEIDWEDIIYIRDHLICTYFDIDYDRVWDTAIKDIPVLEQTIEKLFDELNSSNQRL